MRVSFPAISSPRRLWGRLRDALRGETDESYFDLNDSRRLDDFLADRDATVSDDTSSTGDRVRRIYTLRPDLREAFPLAFTPAGRRDYLAWLLTHGRAEFGVTADECLRFLREEDATPDRGLTSLFRLHPAWQAAVPGALTRFGWPQFKAFLNSTYGLSSRWFRQARCPHFATTRGPGVNVLAHFRYASGLQEAAFGVVKGLHLAGVATSRRDLPVLFAGDWQDRDRYDGLESYETTIYVAAANTFPHEWYPRAGLSPRPGVRKVAVWYWELDELPAAWVPHLSWADEIWAPTEYVAGAFRKVASCPVVPMLPGLELPAFDRKPRSAFELPDDNYLFLVTFDMGSVMARKNPLAVVAAFRRAFRDEVRVHLAIKVSRGDSRPGDYEVLKAAVAATPGVTLIDHVMTRSDVLALLDTADCYVSAHRAEGLGLGLAESMLLGKPTIATGYSGNLDFMTSETSDLIDYRLVPVGRIDSPYNPYPPTATWAEPDVEHLASLLRANYERPEAGREKGRRARAHVSRVMSPGAFGARMKARLDHPVNRRSNGP